jgi:hypothetical protein
MRPAGLLRREALERLGSTSPPTSTTRSRCLTSSVIYCWWLADRRPIVPDRLASAASRASIAGDAVGPLSGRLNPISILARARSSSSSANVVDPIHPRYFPLPLNTASEPNENRARPQENDVEVRDLL